MSANEKKYKEMPVDSLVPYERNARTHSDEQVDKIIRSIEEFGFINPVLVNKDNVIIAGHGRVMAAKKMGLKKVPCLYVEHLTDEQMRAYVIADNKLAEDAGWDMEILQSELAELKDLNFDITLTGFDSLEEINTETEGGHLDVVEDDYDPEPPKEPKSKPGQIYKLGRHRLMCGDSTNLDDVNKLMDGNLADMVMTDPPYNVAVENADGLTIANDNMSSNDFLFFLQKAFTCLSESLKAGGSFYIWYASCETLNFYQALQGLGLMAKQELIWRKNQFTLGRQDYQWAHEPCIYGWKEGAGHYFIESRRECTIFDDFPMGYGAMTKEQLVDWIREYFENKDSGSMLYANKPVKDDLHPTMKPLKLIGTLIKNSSEDGCSVLDLFGGSGTTLMVCEQLNRSCYMMEYDPKFVDVIIDRWEQFTGQKAVLISGDN